METKHKVYFNWSSGKDSALALYKYQKDHSQKIDKLVTTLSKDLERVSMHGLRKELLLQQADSIGIPLQIVELDADNSMESYNRKMEELVSGLKTEGFSKSIFGDIFLDDLKEYREAQLKPFGIKAVFPLWKKNTNQLMQEFIDLGFKAIVICTNSKLLDNSFCGRIIDSDFLIDLPDNVDPCGENGEFHTFVFDGPIFKKPVPFQIGEKVSRSYKPSKKNDDDCFTDTDSASWDTEFCYLDLIPKK